MPRTKGQPAPPHVKRAKEIGWNNRQRALAMSKAVQGPKSDAELIAEAIEAGKLQKCPSGVADGALTWRPFDKF